MPVRLRLTKIDEFQFLTCLQHSIWGSRSARFKDWKVGDYLAFIVDKALAALAEVSGEPLVSRERIWDNGLFPHRIPLKFLHVLAPSNRPAILGEIRDGLTSAWGANYGWGILNQQPLEGKPAEAIAAAIRSLPSDLPEVARNLERYLDEAKQQRNARQIFPRAEPRKQLRTPVEVRADERIGAKDESLHSKAQRSLIQLGSTTGCQVWIAANDRNRTYRGKPLGEGTLKSLPNLGLNEDATRRISLVDVIWIRQNSPVCAFEVETTTSVYSGLLRMSDLLSVVPALNIKLFIVAPRERQDKALAELSRPTFQKIGLSEYCRFIPAEDLDSLLAKVLGLRGHIQPTIIDTIAIELEAQVGSSLE